MPTRNEYLSRLKFDWSAHQPIGAHGFRKGTWTVLLDGKPMRIFVSVPHGADLETQRNMVLGSAADWLARVRP